MTLKKPNRTNNMIKLIKFCFYKESHTRRLLADFISKPHILSMNQECHRFEENFSKKQKRLFSVLVFSGSAANLILIQSMLNLGLFKVGDKIGISSLTWATNVMPLLQLGLIPVALDVNINTLNVSVSEIKKHIKSIKGLFITNVLGLCGDLPAIRKICQKNKIVL